MRTRTAYYMSFRRVTDPAADRVGGIPTLCPPKTPRHYQSANPLCFLAQFNCTKERLALAGMSCIQVYQCSVDEIGEGYDPSPVAIVLPADAQRYVGGGEIASQYGVEELQIDWEERQDPVEILERETRFQVMGSKAEGTPWSDFSLEDGDRMLLTIREDPAGFNFAGMTMMVILKPDGKLRVDYV
jgi:hypothetical protein